MAVGCHLHVKGILRKEMYSREVNVHRGRMWKDQMFFSATGGIIWKYV